MTDFAIIRVSGKDSLTLLNNLSTNLIKPSPCTTAYSCLLTPNGRFMYDFLLLQEENQAYLATNKNSAEGLIKYISMYKMASECILEQTQLNLYWSSHGTFQDPRHPSLGFYTISSDNPANHKDYHIHRMQLKIVDGFYDLTQKESIILDYGFDNINAISYTKGCYLGQELIARTHHTGVVRKKVYYFQCNENIKKGMEITQNGEKIGKVLGGVDGHHLAVIKFESLDEVSTCQAGGLEFTVH